MVHNFASQRCEWVLMGTAQLGSGNGRVRWLAKLGRSKPSASWCRLSAQRTCFSSVWPLLIQALFLSMWSFQPDILDFTQQLVCKREETEAAGLLKALTQKPQCHFHFVSVKESHETIDIQGKGDRFYLFVVKNALQRACKIGLIDLTTSTDNLPHR